MSSSLTWQGLDDLRDALRSLPDDLTASAGPIVLNHALEADRTIETDYPRVTGNLKAGVRLEVANANRFGVAARVRSGSPHASMFERGTKDRRTRRGWNRGSMPPAAYNEAMIPAAIRVRGRMIGALIAMVRGYGLIVRDY